jgi:hypothetical protein
MKKKIVNFAEARLDAFYANVHIQKSRFGKALLEACQQ